MKNHYIYLTIDTLKKKFYIGKRTTSKEVKEDSYFGSGTVIKNILKKHSKEEVIKRLHKIIICESKSAEENNVAEVYWVDYFKAPKNPNFYNIALGGDGGGAGNPSEETRAKMSKAQKGRVTSEKTKAKISSANKGRGKGRKLSEETKIKISNAGKGRKHSEETKVKMSKRAVGKKHSEETKEKLSMINKNKKLSEETKAKISKGLKGENCSAETRKKISELHKGRKRSEETRKKMCENSKGKNKGKIHSEETKRKMSEVRKKNLFLKKIIVLYLFVEALKC